MTPPLETITLGPTDARAVLARPDGTPRRGILVLHPWWGLNPFVTDTTRDLAAAGALALAPDLLGGRVVTTIDEANASVRAPSPTDDEQEATVLAGIDRLAAEGCDAIAVLGWSFGAAWATWAATKRAAIDRVALVYGGWAGHSPAESSASYLIHAAGKDEYEAVEDLAAVRDAALAAGHPAELHVYEGLSHWFTEPDRPEYDAAATALVWERTRAFLGLAEPVR